MTTDNDAATHMDEAQSADSLFDALYDDSGIDKLFGATNESGDEAEGLEDDTQVDEDAVDVDDGEYDDSDEESDSEDDAELPEDEEETEELYLDVSDHGDYKVTIKVDGEESDVDLAHLVKNYQTDKSLSQKGDKLAEQQKALEAAAGQNEFLFAMSAKKISEEQERDDRALEAKKQAWMTSDDSFDSDKRQKEYVKAQEAHKRRKDAREGEAQELFNVYSQNQESAFGQRIEYFQQTIPSMISDWSPEVQEANQEFARELGIPEDVLMNMVDPHVVKAFDDFRRMSKGAAKGAVKRKAVPVKGIKPKKPVPAATKKKVANAETRKKVLSGKGNKREQSQFLDSLMDNILPEGF